MRRRAVETMRRRTYLVGDVWTGVGDVSAGLCEDALVVVAVQEGVLDVALSAALCLGAAGDSVGLQTGVLQDDEESALGRGEAGLGYVGLDGEHGGVVRGGLSRLGGREGTGRTLWAGDGVDVHGSVVDGGGFWTGRGSELDGGCGGGSGMATRTGHWNVWYKTTEKFHTASIIKT